MTDKYIKPNLHNKLLKTSKYAIILLIIVNNNGSIMIKNISTKQVKIQAIQRLALFQIKKGKLFHFGFTLAEVLITLGIIGIVAAMTIPTLINKTNDLEYKNAYKEAISVASQALMTAVSNNELVYVPGTGGTNYVQRNINFYYFRSHFKVIKDCGTTDSAGVTTFAASPTDCWATGDTIDSPQTQPDAAALVSFVDNSGRAWAQWKPNLDSAGAIIIFDINGNKGPNKFGQDRFFVDLSDGSADVTTTPTLIKTRTDYVAYDAVFCKYGATHPCYYNSWLYN